MSPLQTAVPEGIFALPWSSFYYDLGVPSVFHFFLFPSPLLLWCLLPFLKHLFTEVLSALLIGSGLVCGRCVAEQAGTSCERHRAVPDLLPHTPNVPWKAEVSVLVCALFIYRIDFQKASSVYKERDTLLSDFLTFSLSEFFSCSLHLSVDSTLFEVLEDNLICLSANKYVHFQKKRDFFICVNTNTYMYAKPQEIEDIIVYVAESSSGQT